MQGSSRTRQEVQERTLKEEPTLEGTEVQEQRPEYELNPVEHWKEVP